MSIEVIGFFIPFDKCSGGLSIPSGQGLEGKHVLSAKVANTL
jgi:hypothetical protein